MPYKKTAELKLVPLRDSAGRIYGWYSWGNHKANHEFYRRTRTIPGLVRLEKSGGQWYTVRTDDRRLLLKRTRKGELKWVKETKSQWRERLV